MVYDDVYEELLTIVSEVGARPDVPIESEQFFTELVEGFQGSKEEFVSFVRRHVRDWFRSLDGLPDWMQDAEWQFSGGKPMIFIGQFEVPHSANLFHDDERFYLFWSSETGETKTVFQIA